MNHISHLSTSQRTGYDHFLQIPYNLLPHIITPFDVAQSETLTTALNKPQKETLVKMHILVTLHIDCPSIYVCSYQRTRVTYQRKH
jgi:hypothetical protein